MGINDSGQVVGATTGPARWLRAFFYIGAGTFVLQSSEVVDTDEWTSNNNLYEVPSA
jgi:hypothetical protein